MIFYKKNFNTVPVLSVISLGLFLLIVSLFLYLFIIYTRDQKNGLVSTSNNNAELRRYAEQIIKDCAEVSYRPNCYDEEIPKLMDLISMEDAFNVTRIVQDRDNSYTYCHVLGHNLSARELDKDPSKWKEVVARSPRGICSNGAIHGVLQEKFRAESLNERQIEGLLPDLADVCEDRASWHPTGLEQGSCYHALGHLSMYITNANINSSVEICGKIAIKGDGRNFTQVCYDGAFMQIYQPLEPEDFALVNGKQPNKDEVQSFCKAFSQKQRVSCWNESWPLFRDKILTSDGLVKFCSDPILQIGYERNRCFEAMFYVITPQLRFDEDVIQRVCNNLPTDVTGKCFGNVATRMIETDYRNVERAVNFCSKANILRFEEECYSILTERANFFLSDNSPELGKLCSSLPDNWGQKCIGRI